MDQAEAAIRELRMDETQRVIEELKRGGDQVETHAGGDGVITIQLVRRATHRPPVVGHGPTFPAALSAVLRAVEQSETQRADDLCTSPPGCRA